MTRPWLDEQRLEELGYTERCWACGRIGDTDWCGCPAGAEPDDRDEEDDDGDDDE